MSLSNSSRLLERIASATEASPIAVFKTEQVNRKGENMFDSFFSASVYGQNKIKANKSNLIGIFTRKNKRREIFRALDGNSNENSS